MHSPLLSCEGQLPSPLWRAALRMPRPVGRGLRRIQFLSLLLTRSYGGLLHSLNWWDIIDESFLLGGALMFEHDIERLQRQGVGAVINLCAERRDNPYRLAAAFIDYLWLPVIDTCAPTLQQIDHGLAWMNHQRHRGNRVYVHCAVGVGTVCHLVSMLVYRVTKDEREASAGFSQSATPASLPHAPSIAAHTGFCTCL